MSQKPQFFLSSVVVVRDSSLECGYYSCEKSEGMSKRKPLRSNYRVFSNKQLLL